MFAQDITGVTKTQDKYSVMIRESNQGYYKNDFTMFDKIIHDDAVFTIGGLTTLTSTTYFKGDLCELIVFNRALNTNELATVKDYLNNKYRIY